MTKNKPRIDKKSFSWENKKIKKCDFINCKNEGKYKAPKSRINLYNYYFFCLKHVKEYNNSWDFYKGLSVDNIEAALREDVIWNRPSWPLHGKPNIILDKITSFFKNHDNLFNDDKNYKNFSKNKFFHTDLTQDEQKSLKILKINVPIDVEKIKKAYKKLVKIYHPDVNKDVEKAEKNFKEINQAYKILLKRFLNKK